MTPRRLAAVIAANAMMRVAGGASGMLVGVYAADLANRGLPIDATIVGCWRRSPSWRRLLVPVQA